MTPQAQTHWTYIGATQYQPSKWLLKCRSHQL